MWNYVNTDDDIRLLMDKLTAFHDMVVLRVAYCSSDKVCNDGVIFGDRKASTISLLIGSMLKGQVELLFSGVKKFSFQSDEYHTNEISVGYLAFHNDLYGRTRDDRLIVWADSPSFHPSSYVDELDIKRKNTSYIIADNVKWRYVDDNDIAIE